jgi:hypothetical protein
MIAKVEVKVHKFIKYLRSSKTIARNVVVEDGVVGYRALP